MSRSMIPLLSVAALAAAACAETPSAHGPMDEASLHAQHSRSLPPSPEVNRQLAELRRLLAPYHNYEKAKEAGWSARITPCWESNAQGGMGFHYANPEFLFDEGRVDLMEPEALMFEPGPGGQMKLVGMEYIVFLDDWTSSDPPELLGQPFHVHPDLPIWKLHLWLWKDNPNGMFADWNPRVSCRHTADAEYF